jgi:membrane protein YdbS with pleckstrin-like domain
MGKLNNTTGTGMGFASTLALIFVILRLIPATPGPHIINWSWWWVLSPIWISWLAAIVLILLVLVVVVIYKIFNRN